MKTFGILTAFLLGMIGQLLGETWTSEDGKTIEADFVVIEGDNVVLDIDGKEARVSLSRLNAASQAKARKLQVGLSEWTAFHLGMPVLTVKDARRLLRVDPDGMEGEHFLLEGRVSAIGTGRTLGVAVRLGQTSIDFSLEGVGVTADFSHKVDGGRRRLKVEGKTRLLMVTRYQHKADVDETLMKVGDTVVIHADVLRGKLVGRGLASSEEVARAQALHVVREANRRDGDRPEAEAFVPEFIDGSGTAFAISTDGYLVTNHHVVAGAITISVSFGQEKAPAKLVAKDARNDLAILKIDADTVPLYLERDSVPELGAKVVVGGYPNIEIQGRKIKVTSGTLSSLTGADDNVACFQIDAAIQPGNSGSPLMDEKGRVIGVVVSTLNSMFVAEATGSLPQNVNYAVKIDYLMPVVKSVPGLLEKVDAVEAPVDEVPGRLLPPSTAIVEVRAKNPDY